MPKRRWTKKEESILKEKYPQQGSTIPELNRTRTSIRHKAGRLGLSVPTTRPNNSPQYRDKKWLSQKYVNERLPTREIADLCDVDPSTISYWLKKFNIPRRCQPGGKLKWTEEEEGILREKYPEQGPNIPELDRTKKAIYEKAKKLKISCNNKRRMKALIRGSRRRPTSIERKFIDLCSTHGLPYRYVGDGSFWILNMNPDFVNVNGKKIAIEILGDYWHTEEEFEERKKKFAEYGWKCVGVWGHELRELKKEELLDLIP